MVFDVLVFRMVWLIECDFLNSPYGVLSIFHKKMVLAALNGMGAVSHKLSRSFISIKIPPYP